MMHHSHPGIFGPAVVRIYHGGTPPEPCRYWTVISRHGDGTAPGIEVFARHEDAAEWCASLSADPLVGLGGWRVCLTDEPTSPLDVTEQFRREVLE